jgi:hypothetical protein
MAFVTIAVIPTFKRKQETILVSKKDVKLLTPPLMAYLNGKISRKLLSLNRETGMNDVRFKREKSFSI